MGEHQADHRVDDIVEELNDGDTDAATNLFNDIYREGGQSALNSAAEEVADDTKDWWREAYVTKDKDGNVSQIHFDDGFLFDTKLFDRNDIKGSVGQRVNGLRRSIGSALDPKGNGGR